MRVYIDGIFDLFHIGHLKAFYKAKNQVSPSKGYLKSISEEKNKLIVGIISDKDSKNYKREPIISENCRVEIIKNLRIVDDIIFPAPLIVTKEFLDKNNIDLVVHGFSNKEDYEKQKHFFKNISDKFKIIEYNSEESTTDIINRCKKVKFLN